MCERNDRWKMKFLFITLLIIIVATHSIEEPRFLYPQSGDIITTDNLYGDLQFVWTAGDLKNVYARFRKDAEAPINFFIRNNSIVSIKGKGKIYGSHTVSVRHYVLDEQTGQETFLGPEISSYFDVVPSRFETFVNSKLPTPLLPEIKITAMKRKPKILIVAGIYGINGQIELYIRQCEKLSRQRIRSVEWLLMSAVDETDPTSQKTLSSVKRYCDKVHFLPIQLSQNTHLEINATSSRDVFNALVRALQQQQKHVSESLQKDLKPMITFLSQYDIVVFENENQRYFAEILNIANIKASVLQITRPEYDANYDHVSAIVTSSSYVTEMPTLRIAREQGMRVEVFYPGVDLDVFSRDLFEKNMKRRHGNTVRMGFVGRLVSEKSPYLVLRLLRQLEMMNKQQSRRFHLDIVGEGLMMNHLQDTATRMGPFNSSSNTTIMWHGFLSHPDLATLMSTWDVLVFPSVAMETFGLVCVQAMALGVAVVNFGIGGSRVYTSDGFTGFVAESVEELVNTTLRAIDCPVKVKENARELVERFFNYDEYVERNTRLYEELMNT